MTTKTRKRTKTRKVKKKVRPPMVRTSERSSWNTCRWAWNWGYNDRLKPIEERPALKFGTLVHKALEVRYPVGKRRGPKPAQTFEKEYLKACSEVEKQFGIQMRDEEEWVDALELGIDMLEHYLEVYGRDEEWEVVASEMTFKVPVYSPEHPEGGYTNLKGERIPKKVVLFYYVGTMDGVWRNRMSGSTCVNDYKTTANDPVKEALGKALLDEQATAYWTWGVDYLIEKNVLKPRHLESLDGMLYTMLRKSMRDDRPQNAQGHYLNQNGEVSKRQPPAYFHRELIYRSETDREKARERATQQAIEMAQARAGTLAIYKQPDTGSMGHCGWCGYREICELHEQDADWEALRDATMTTWDPYAAHELREEGKAR